VLPAVVLLSVVNASEGMDQISATRGAHAWNLEWSDAEDRLRGFVRPLDPVEGQPLEVSLRVGPFQGADLDGPLIVSLRCDDWSQTLTVPRSKDSQSWLAELTPHGNGDCRLDVGWQTTRRKLVHMTLPVAPAPLPRTPWYIGVGLIAAAALALGIRAALKRPE
jgi:hypothetical protein